MLALKMLVPGRFKEELVAQNPPPIPAAMLALSPERLSEELVAKTPQPPKPAALLVMMTLVPLKLT